MLCTLVHPHTCLLRPRKLRVSPGKDLVPTLPEEEMDADDPSVPTSTAGTSKSSRPEPEVDDSDKQSSESERTTTMGKSSPELEEVTKMEESCLESGGEISELEATQPFNGENDLYMPKEGDYIVGQLIYNFGTRKEFERKFVGKVMRCKAGRQKEQYEVSFLRKKKVLDKVDGETIYHHFEYPNIQDIWLLNQDQIIQQLQLGKCARGKYYFVDVPVDDVQ